MSEKKSLFLVDGMSNIFRAYYAIRGLSNSKGMATNAIYGFTMTLRKMIKEQKPDYLGVVLDSKEKTHRQDAYEQYKAHRPEMPEDMVVQLPYIERVCEALRIPIIKKPKYEADDLIGTLAVQAKEKGLRTIIVTNDKDLSQLVSDPAIAVLRVDKNGETLLDEKGVKEKHGVRPDQIVDWLGLMGDAVDGIPGAPGIGEKGAVQLLEQFGSIEAALEGWEQVQRKTYRESLRDHADQIRMSRELARIDLNVEVELDLKALIYEEPDPKLAYELFSELEFHQLTREFAAGATGATGAAGAAGDSSQKSGSTSSEKTGEEYRQTSSIADLEKLAGKIYDADRAAFSLTTDKSGDLTGVAFSVAPGVSEYFDLEGCDNRQEALRILGEIFDNGLVEKCTHDHKRALYALGRLGMTLENVADDTLIEAYLLEPERSKLELPILAAEHLDTAIKATDKLIPAQEADVVIRLSDVLRGKIEEDEIQFDFQQEKLGFIYHKVEMPLIPVLYGIERAGFRVDADVLAVISVEMAVEIEKITGKIYELAGREFNIASPQQLGEIFEELNFEVSKKTATGKISTSRDVLDELAAKYELPRLIIDHRELSKLKSTYVDAFPSLIDPEDGRIHTTLNQAATATGRLSSTDPNLQNIPVRTEMGRRIRRAFIPADGHVLLSADYSQIELRLLAHITKDPVMIETFRKGEDIHSRTAREVFGAKTSEELKETRRLAKIVNFGIAYVIGPYGLAQRVGISRTEARKVIDDYYRTYAGVKKYMDELPELARKNDCVVRSVFGRIRRMNDLKSKGPARSRAEREAVNMPMQGSASDIVKLAMLRVAEALRKEKLKARMILQIHDELVFEVPNDEAKLTVEVVKHAMEHAAKLDVPLTVDAGYGDNWVNAKP
ncbi:MAG: DNA polymerase I [Acidobacteria bacterium]|nr:DNA polymerase I [Acidobacteriota bacterium]